MTGKIITGDVKQSKNYFIFWEFKMRWRRKGDRWMSWKALLSLIPDRQVFPQLCEEAECWIHLGIFGGGHVPGQHHCQPRWASRIHSSHDPILDWGGRTQMPQITYDLLHRIGNHDTGLVDINSQLPYVPPQSHIQTCNLNTCFWSLQKKKTTAYA